MEPVSSSDDLANPLLENTDEGTELASGTELVDADGAELREATDGAHPLVADAEAQRARPPSPTTSSPSRASMASVAAAPDALREGLVVELWHARRRYAAAGSHEHLARYLSRFVAGTWCRCVVEDFDGETYTLRYEDGPHAARSRAFAPVAGLPRGTRFVRCPRDCIEVDYEASYCAVSPEGRYALSHGVVVVPFIVAAQLFCYFYYAARECERTGRAIEAYSPVAGPGGDRFAFAATSHFPGCRDLRGREWYRFWTYQWLHEGWAHVSTTAWHSNPQSNGSDQPPRPCFESSTRAIDPSQNQPNRLRIDRAREFQSLVGTSQTGGRFPHRRRRALVRLLAARVVVLRVALLGPAQERRQRQRRQVPEEEREDEEKAAVRVRAAADAARRREDALGDEEGRRRDEEQHLLHQDVLRRSRRRTGPCPPSPR